MFEFFFKIGILLESYFYSFRCAIRIRHESMCPIFDCDHPVTPITPLITTTPAPSIPNEVSYVSFIFNGILATILVFLIVVFSVKKIRTLIESRNRLLLLEERMRTNPVLTNDFFSIGSSSPSERIPLVARHSRTSPSPSGSICSSISESSKKRKEEKEKQKLALNLLLQKEEQFACAAQLHHSASPPSTSTSLPPKKSQNNKPKNTNSKFQDIDLFSDDITDDYL
jgi:hypothetical protein